MQVKETSAEGLKHEFEINVPAAEIEAKAERELAEMKDKVRLNGFRPGKVPTAHLKRLYGRSVMAETIEQMIRDTNAGIFTERGFKLATEPKVTMPSEEKDVEKILERQDRPDLHGGGRSGAADRAGRFQGFSLEKPVADVSRCRRRRGDQADRATRTATTRRRPMAPRPRAATA